jgi:hypothetical protein
VGALATAPGTTGERGEDEATTIVWGVDANDLGSIAVSSGRLFVGFEREVREFADGAPVRRAAWPRHEVEVDVGRMVAMGGQVYYFVGRAQRHEIQRVDLDAGTPPTTFLDLNVEMRDIAADKDAVVVATSDGATVAPLPAGPTWTASFPNEHTRGLAIDAAAFYVSVGHALWRVDRRDRTKSQIAAAGAHRLIEAAVSDGANVCYFASPTLSSDGSEDAGDASRTVVMRVPARGGPATQLATLPESVNSAAMTGGVLFAGMNGSVVAIDATTGRVQTVDTGWAYPRRLVVDGRFLYYRAKSGVRRVAVTRRIDEARVRLPSCSPVADAPEPPAESLALGQATEGRVGRIESDASGVYWTAPEADRIMHAPRPVAGVAHGVRAMVVADHQAKPSSLALGGGTAYWIADEHDVTRAGPDGKGPTVIWRTKGQANALAVLGGVVYWAERIPEYDEAVMALGPAPGPPRDVLHLPAVVDVAADGESLFFGLHEGGIVRFDPASARARILAGTDMIASLSVAGPFVYWASPRETVAYRVDKRGGVPQALMVAPRGSLHDVEITAISTSGDRAVWMAKDDFNDARITEGDLSGRCARILWSTVDSTASAVHADDLGVYWGAGGRVLTQGASVAVRRP